MWNHHLFVVSWNKKQANYSCSILLLLQIHENYYCYLQSSTVPNYYCCKLLLFQIHKKWSWNYCFRTFLVKKSNETQAFINSWKNNSEISSFITSWKIKVLLL